MRMANRWLIAAAIFWSAPASVQGQSAPARPCVEIEEAGASYTVCEFDARKSTIRLFLSDEKGAIFGGFAPLADALAAKGERLAFAMNAGMYDAAFLPVGLYVEAGATRHAANTASGEGNFHMKPNGVFWIDGARAGVSETGRFLKSRARPAYATQSGPMLVAGGRINPHIHDNGTSEKLRNGVGAADGHIVRFAISNKPVTFHQFAHLFRERLKCPDALFLDGGSASALYAPSISRHDRFHPMGPLIGVVEEAGYK
jgi:uncharacterized protein YigE (DUF2233 family)